MGPGMSHIILSLLSWAFRMVLRVLPYVGWFVAAGSGPGILETLIDIQPHYAYGKIYYMECMGYQS